MMSRSRLDDPGSGFDRTSSRVLVYADLRSVTPQPDQRAPEREVELHITGNMEVHVVVRWEKILGGARANSLSTRRAPPARAGE
jgi:hypothetical protein